MLTSVFDPSPIAVEPRKMDETSCRPADQRSWRWDRTGRFDKTRRSPRRVGRHGPLPVDESREVLHLVVHLRDEAILALLRVAKGGRVVRRRQVGGKHVLE